MKKLFWLLVAVLVMSTALAQQTRLRVFVGGQQRPDVMRKIFDLYQSRNPGVRVDLEVGGATSDQQQYLTTVLASRDPSIDVILIDVIRPAQYLASRWAFTLAVAQGKGNVAALEFASAVAALHCARGQPPTLAEVRAFLGA